MGLTHLDWPAVFPVIALIAALACAPLQEPIIQSGYALIYVIFTSGSTGVPKGVWWLAMVLLPIALMPSPSALISASAIVPLRFLHWMVVAFVSCSPCHITVMAHWHLKRALRPWGMIEVVNPCYLFYIVTPDEPWWPAVPYGKPQANWHCRVVDGHERDCPNGVKAEMWISCAGVADDYIADAQLSAEKFVVRQGAIWYCSGDPTTATTAC
ncbi:MAG: hypothetical protein ACR5LD_08455 [Symbiopectobacterium sp.]